MLTAALMRRLYCSIIVLTLAGCPPPAVLPSGCGKDVDCRAPRICVQHVCVEPPQRREPPVSDGGQVAATAVDAGGAEDASAPAAPVVAMPAAQPVGVSSMFHGDAQHTGRSRNRAPTSVPHEVMHVATGGVVVSSPAITESGVLVFGSHDKSVYGAASDGTIAWRKPTQDLVWCAPALGPGGVAYVGSDDDRLYALDVADGSLRWQFTAGPCRTAVGFGPEAARCDVDGVTVGPDGTVYLVADGLYALAADGTLKWRFSPGHTHCAAAPALGADGTVYFGCHDDALYAVDAQGQKRWEYRTQDDVDSPPAVGADGTIYFGSDDKKLYALTPAGTLKWALATSGAVRSGPAIAADGTIYVGSFDGHLYAVRPTGAVAWTLRTADRILSSPLIDAAGVVLIGSQDDRLYAVAADGKLQWSVLLDGDVDGTPVLGADGTIYVGTDDRALHGLR
jgi:outer membrane protein assembly factor BamB